jgi:hypothetical protein
MDTHNFWSSKSLLAKDEKHKRPLVRIWLNKLWNNINIAIEYQLLKKKKKRIRLPFCEPIHKSLQDKKQWETVQNMYIVCCCLGKRGIAGDFQLMKDHFKTDQMIFISI